ncbi:transposase domain-containing protein [Nonomuraea polychroma]|uniref:transposase domain-containing protein n=1 Tax=Nonomuraea polychroma TaxID=46176 RepID=UPI000FDD4CC0
MVVYLLIALCLFPDDDYEEVAEKLTGMLELPPVLRTPDLRSSLIIRKDVPMPSPHPSEFLAGSH